MTTATPRRRRWRFGPYETVITLVALAVMVYLAFFSEKSVTQRLQYQHVIDSLQTVLQQQQDTLELYRDLNRRLNTDPELMEQVVREQYNMKRPHEDVFLIEH